MKKLDVQHATPRRGFLGLLASGAAALGLMSIPTRLMANDSNAEISLSGHPSDAFFGRIKGKHRIVYDASTPHDGFPLAWSWVFLTTNNQTGTADQDLSVVVVLRHDAIPLAMEDNQWAKYKLGEVFKITDKATKEPALRNPYWNSKEGDLPKLEMSIDQLQKRGVMFCVCDMALTVYSGMVGKKMGMDGAEVKKDWLAHLHPNIEVVPSGVWAIGRAQEHRCAYCFAG